MPRKGEFHTKIAGATKKNEDDESVQKLLKEISDICYEGELLSLEHESDNPYDKNAIKVYYGFDHIGYIKRELAEELAPLVDEKRVEAEMCQVTGGEDGKSYGCNILIRIVEEGEEARTDSRKFVHLGSVNIGESSKPKTHSNIYTTSKFESKNKGDSPPNINSVSPSPYSITSAEEKFYFDGTILQLVGYSILAALLTAVTFGIGYPWALCMLQRWETSHTLIGSRRLRFTGTGLQLLGKWIVLAVIPFAVLVGALVVTGLFIETKAGMIVAGIIGFGLLICGFLYGYFVVIELKKWTIQHTEFDMQLSQPTPALPDRPAPIYEQSTSFSRPTSKPFPLKSKDLVKADGMITYCEWFRFDNGASKELCRRLFEKSEPSVSPDKEVVMTFMSIRDYISQIDNGGPCACVFGATKFIIASDSKVEVIKVTDIEGFSLDRRGQQSVITLKHRDGAVDLYADNSRASALISYCKSSLDACKKELEELAKA